MPLGNASKNEGLLEVFIFFLRNGRAEAYSELCQTSKMVLSAGKVYGF